MWWRPLHGGCRPTMAEISVAGMMVLDDIAEMAAKSP